MAQIWHSSNEMKELFNNHFYPRSLIPLYVPLAVKKLQKNELIQLYQFRYFQILVLLCSSEKGYDEDL